MWKLPVLEAKPAAKSVDTDVIPVFQDGPVGNEKPIVGKGNYARVVEKFRRGDAFSARVGQTQFVRFGGRKPAESALLVGFGPLGQASEEKARVAGGNAWSKLVAEKSRSAVIHVDQISDARLIRPFAEGLVLGAYQFNKYKSGNVTKKPEYIGPSRLNFVSRDKLMQAELAGVLEQVSAMIECVNITRDWSNEPSNYGTPEYYAAEAQRLARAYGIKCTVMTEKDCEREKMGLFLGVGRGSERDGRVVILEYAPKASAKGQEKGRKPKTIALVGKGITFDSGGISIKPSMRMEEMKHDMTGAATMMGAILLAARWRVPNRVVAVMVFTENMPDGMAIQPGNVLTGRSGKTVEVWNTDAEGRLILGDALDLAQDYKPDVVIDAATLTGAVSVALGKQCCGVMGNNDKLIERLSEIGAGNGERMWQLPLFDEYFEDLKSDLADMKNVANDSLGGTIRAGMFLKQFIKKNVPWAHLDIAATAWGLTHVPYYPKKGASGAYVRTLAQFAAEF